MQFLLYVKKKKTERQTNYLKPLNKRFKVYKYVNFLLTEKNKFYDTL